MNASFYQLDKCVSKCGGHGVSSQRLPWLASGHWSPTFSAGAAPAGAWHGRRSFFRCARRFCCDRARSSPKHTPPGTPSSGPSSAAQDGAAVAPWPAWGVSVPHRWTHRSLWREPRLAGPSPLPLPPRLTFTCPVLGSRSHAGEKPPGAPRESLPSRLKCPLALLGLQQQPELPLRRRLGPPVLREVGAGGQHRQRPCAVRQ